MSGSSLKDQDVPNGSRLSRPIGNVRFWSCASTTARPTCLSWLPHWVRRAASRALCTAGRSRPTSVAMMAITTRSSTSVNPRGREARVRFVTGAMGVSSDSEGGEEGAGVGLYPQAAPSSHLKSEPGPDAATAATIPGAAALGEDNARLARATHSAVCLARRAAHAEARLKATAMTAQPPA